MLNRNLAAHNLRELAYAWEAQEENPQHGVAAYPLAFLEARGLAGQGYQIWYEKLTFGFRAYGLNSPGEISLWSEVCAFSPSEHVIFWSLLAAAIEAGDFQ